jgi:hypothetical protein
MEPDVIFEHLLEVVPMGGAVCLVGAGFSVGATDQRGKTVPDSQKLIKEIMAAVEIDPAEDATLADIADYCRGHSNHQQVLRVSLLIG